MDTHHNIPEFGITRENEEVAVGAAHLQSWKESYLDIEHGITEEVINTLRGDTITEKGMEIKRKVFTDAREHPERVLYRVVRNESGIIVGFLHCTKNETNNELVAIYLLNEAKGYGVGGRLMQEFLTWADKDKPSYVEVFSSNKKALGFYERYGFRKTEKPAEMYKNTLEYIEMLRPADIG